MEKRDVRCKKHPSFDPLGELDLPPENERCTCCHRLFYGFKHVGYFHGEYRAEDLHPKRVDIEIGPLSREQFGYVRHTLFWDHVFRPYGKVSWHADGESLTVYLVNALPTVRVDDFLDKGCRVFARKR